MKIGYYPGCSLLGSSREFGESVRAVARALGVDLVEVPDWSCCGATSAHSLHHVLATALPANVLSRAAQAGMDEVLAPCASCYSRLVGAQADLASNPELRKRVEEVLDAPVAKPVRVLNILEFLDKALPSIAEKVKEPFARTVACYYGCLLVRPPRPDASDRPEDPQAMDRLVRAVGGKSVDWNFKTECCGAAFSVARTSVVAKLSGRILEDAARHKIEAVVVACPMCHSNLDMRRSVINAELGKKHEFPVLFITQVIGLALGLSPEELGLYRHFVPATLPRVAAV